MKIRCIVNGEEKKIDVPPLKPLRDVLREELEILSVRGNCRSGSCGGCLVILEEDLVYSCLIPAFRIQDSKITTVEGLAKSRIYGSLNGFLQENHLPYCRHCTPNFLIAVTALLQKVRNPTEADLREAVSSIYCA